MDEMISEPSPMEVIGGIVSESTVELFSDYGCVAERVCDRESDLYSPPTVLIDAGSDELEINLSIQAPLSVLAMSYPVSSDNLNDIPDADLEDWLSEIANQLIGRIKQNLVKRECYISIGLPQAFYGDEWTGFEAPQEHCFSYVFCIDGEDCEVHLYTQIFSELFSISSEETASDDVQEAGELELF